MDEDAARLQLVRDELGALADALDEGGDFTPEFVAGATWALRHVGDVVDPPA